MRQFTNIYIYTINLLKVNTTLSTTYHDEEEAEKKNSTIKSIQSFIKDSTRK